MSSAGEPVSGGLGASVVGGSSSVVVSGGSSRKEGGGAGDTRGMGAVVVAVGFAALALVGAGVYFVCFRKRRREGEDGGPREEGAANAATADAGTAASAGAASLLTTPLLFSQDWGDEEEGGVKAAVVTDQSPRANLIGKDGSVVRTAAAASQQTAASGSATEQPVRAPQADGLPAAAASSAAEAAKVATAAEVAAVAKAAAAAAAADPVVDEADPMEFMKTLKDRSRMTAAAMLHSAPAKKQQQQEDMLQQQVPAPAAEPAPSKKRSASSSIAAGDGVNLVLEVITGPAAGSKAVRRAQTLEPWPSVTIGRVKANDLPLNGDPEVSSKHAIVSWNALAGRWEVVDRGSLNGTRLNGELITEEEDEEGNRREGVPRPLNNGDIIVCGDTSRIVVRIFADSDSVESVTPAAPFAVAVAADPMRARKGGKSLPMEDVACCEWPLRGIPSSAEFGIFCVFDGHAGRQCADNVKRILPQRISEVLLAQQSYKEVQSKGDASDVLRETFRITEAELPNEDEGCTGTVLLVWRQTVVAAAVQQQEQHSTNGNSTGSSLDGLWLQAANLGDSHCVIGVGEESTVMTEDHRLTGPVEKQRLASIGKPLPEGATRLCGMNIARVFGDKFLKMQDVGLSSDPFVHAPLPLPQPRPDAPVVGVIASDGLWDVMSPKKAIQIAQEARRENKEAGKSNHAEAMASALVAKAKALKTHDNTTVVAIDFCPKA